MKLLPWIIGRLSCQAAQEPANAPTTSVMRSLKFPDLPGTVVWNHSVNPAHAIPTNRLSTRILHRPCHRLSVKRPTDVRNPRPANNRKWPKIGISAASEGPVPPSPREGASERLRKTAVTRSHPATTRVTSSGFTRQSIPGALGLPIDLCCLIKHLMNAT